MDIQKRYRWFVAAFVILGVATFSYYCYRLVRIELPSGPIIGLIPVAVMAVFFRIMQGYYYRRGYFSQKQAERFCERCKEAGIVFISNNNIESVRKIYSEEVFHLTGEELEKIKELELYQKIFANGKKKKGAD